MCVCGGFEENIINVGYKNIQITTLTNKFIETDLILAKGIITVLKQVRFDFILPINSVEFKKNVHRNVTQLFNLKNIYFSIVKSIFRHLSLKFVAKCLF